MNKKFQNYLHSLVFTGGSVIKVGNTKVSHKNINNKLVVSEDVAKDVKEKKKQ